MTSNEHRSDRLGVAARGRADMAFRLIVSAAQDVCLASVFALLALAEARRVSNGQFSSAFLAIELGLLCVIFVVRRRPRGSSRRAGDWLVASVATWLALALRPHAAGAAEFESLGVSVQCAGLALTVFAYMSLGKSFGLVPADRGIEDGGPYRWVRHPVYVSECVTLIGFLIANPTVLNLAIEVIILGAQLVRIHAEERFLRQHHDYRAYAAFVRWRLIPGVF